MSQGSKIAILVLIVTFLVVGSLVAFILIEVNSPQTGSNDHEDSSDDGFNWVIFIPIWLGGILPAIIGANEASKKKQNQSSKYSRQADSQSKPEYYTSTPPAFPTRPGLKFCTNCAASIAPDSIYCEYCGAKVE
ncbi:MAG: zinc-ribbon domain-containing protein [Promethearchaeota archaeon]